MTSTCHHFMRSCASLSRRLWEDQAGSVASAELMLIMTLLCIGMLVGIKSFRDAAVTEFADMGQAVSNLNQSYSYELTIPPGVNGTVGSSSFVDDDDFCDNTGDTDVGVSGSKCVNVCIAAAPE